MQSSICRETIESLCSAAKRLTGFQRRQFQAEMAEKYCGGNARVAERTFGWGRDAVNTGLNERRTGIRCIDNFKARGRIKSEVIDQQLEIDIRELVEPKTQADPKFQSTLAFTRATGPAVHAALQDKLKDTGRNVPALRTVVNILNRLGYSLRRVQKRRPEKKFPKQTRSSTMCDRLTSDPRPIRNV